MMRWALSTNVFSDRSIHAAVAAIAPLGYAGVEILTDRPHLDPLTTGKEEINRLARILESTGLTAVSLNANTVACYYGRTFWEPMFEPSLANPDPAARRWRFAIVCRCLEMAAALGASHVSITSGRPVAGTDPRRSLDLLAASLQELTSRAEATGVRIGIEYEPGLLVADADELGDLLDRLQSPWIGASLDIGHSRMAGESLERVLRRLGKRIFHLHLEDIRNRRHYHLVPGDGDIDFGAVLELLERHGYRGFITVELYTQSHAPEQAARRALDYLTRFCPFPRGERVDIENLGLGIHLREEERLSDESRPRGTIQGRP